MLSLSSEWMEQDDLSGATQPSNSATGPSPLL